MLKNFAAFGREPALRYFKTVAKKVRALMSWELPSEDMADFRISLSFVVLATCISNGIPSPSGMFWSELTALRLTWAPLTLT